MGAPERRSGGGRDRVLDGGAILLSALCLAHCLALPFIVAAAPSIAALVPDRPWVHPAILAVAAPLAAVALWRGWAQHGDRRPAIVGGIGLALLAVGVAAGDDARGTAVTVLGGLTLAVAHLRNWRAGHRGHGTGLAPRAPSV